jgi:hypothetical protein
MMRLLRGRFCSQNGWILPNGRRYGFIFSCGISFYSITIGSDYFFISSRSYSLLSLVSHCLLKLRFLKFQS